VGNRDRFRNGIRNRQLHGDCEHGDRRQVGAVQHRRHYGRCQPGSGDCAGAAERALKSANHQIAFAVSASAKLRRTRRSLGVGGRGSRFATFARVVGDARNPCGTRANHVNVADVDPADQLVAAVTSDDLSAATECLTRHPELGSRLDDSFPALPFGSTLLLAAVGRGSKPMIDLLLGHGAHIDQRSRWWAGGFGVLDTADPSLADFLIDRGARLDVHAASRLGRIDALKSLLAGDPALVHARGGDGQTPLHVAASADIAVVLLDAGADMNARDVDHESTAAQYAVRDRQSVTRLLVQQGCDTDLLMACAIGDLDGVRRHLDASPTSIAMTVSRDYFPMSNPHAGGTIYIWTLGDHKSAHAVAREFGHESVFRLLIERSPHELAIAAACEVGDADLVRNLLNSRVLDPITMDHGLARRAVDAAGRNDTIALRLMLSAGWPVDARGKHGATALHFAAWHGNLDAVSAVLAHGPSLDIRDNDFQATPIEWAFHGSLQCYGRERGDYAATVEALLAAGAVAPAGDPLSMNASEAVRDVMRRRTGGSPPS
jgi:ankyrin repeat protein